MPGDEIDQLRTLLRRQWRAAGAGDEELYVRIVAGANLMLVPKLLSRCGASCASCGTVRYEGHVHEVIDEHEAIVDGVERRDEATALKAIAPVSIG
jgi:DNA-binding GntR family transcriptional regulator